MSYKSNKNIFKLMRLLSGERSYSIVEIEDLLGINERTFHRYRKAMKELDFVLICNKGKYKQNKKGSGFSIINHSQKRTDLKNYFGKRTLDIKRIYNLLNDTLNLEPPMDFLEQFSKDYQEYLLNQ